MGGYTMFSNWEAKYRKDVNSPQIDRFNSNFLKTQYDFLFSFLAALQQMEFQTKDQFQVPVTT